MADETFLEALQPTLICPLCKGYFRDPLIINCGHNFCRKCIFQHWAASRGNFSCPHCQEEFLVITLSPNRQLRNVAEITKEINLQGASVPGSDKEHGKSKEQLGKGHSASFHKYHHPGLMWGKTESLWENKCERPPYIGNSLVEAEMKLCKAEEVCKETELLMKPYINWEEFLMPAPISIAILGQLVFISAGQGDFSINKNSVEGEFIHFRHSESFQTSLMQVSHKAWDVLNVAHKNMDKIKLLSLHTKTTAQTLFENIDMVDAQLPKYLKDMKSTADKCTQLAQLVELQFCDVISLIQELLKTSLESKRGYNKELEEIRRALEEAKQREMASKQAKEMAEEYYKKMKTQVDELVKDHMKTLENMTTKLDSITVRISEGFINEMNTVPNAITKFVRVLSGKHKVQTNFIKISKYNRKEDEAIAVPDAVPKSWLLLILATFLKNLLDEKGNIQMKLLCTEYQQVMRDSIKRQAEEQRKAIFKNKEKKCRLNTEALEICTSLINICQIFADIQVSGKKGDRDMKRLIDKINAIYKKAQEFDSHTKQSTKSTPFPHKLPNIAKCLQSMEGEYKMELGVIANTRFKIEQSREMLKLTQEEYQRSFESFKKWNKEQTEILSNMKRCQVKQGDFDTVRKMLIKSLEALGRVKEQWEKMVHLFQMISSLLEGCFNHRIKELKKSVEAIQPIANYSSKEFVTDLIYNQIFNASMVAHLVHRIAETCTSVTNTDLMESVSGLKRLITTESFHSSFTSENQKLVASCEEAQWAIQNLVIKKKSEFEINLKKRTEKISLELNTLLPPVSRELQNEIQDTVQQAMRKLTLKGEDQCVKKDNEFCTIYAPISKHPVGNDSASPFLFLESHNYGKKHLHEYQNSERSPEKYVHKSEGPCNGVQTRHSSASC